MSKMGMTLEIELGITGEEDGVDNSDVDSSNYTQPEEVAYAYEELSKITRFYNCSRFWKCTWSLQTRKCKIDSKILKNSQDFVQANSIQFNSRFLFSTVDQVQHLKKLEGISYGVIK
jgi:fructose-bisphosphate aldolase class II